jgi:hypothetical protein
VREGIEEAAIPREPDVLVYISSTYCRRGHVARDRMERVIVEGTTLETFFVTEHLSSRFYPLMVRRLRNV